MYGAPGASCTLALLHVKRSEVGTAADLPVHRAAQQSVAPVNGRMGRCGQPGRNRSDCRRLSKS